MRVKRKFLDPDIARKNSLLDSHLIGRGACEKSLLFAVIEFNLTGLCNRKCVFCPRSDPKIFPNVNKHISTRLYEKVMLDLKKAEFKGTILYSSFGEPLLYKNIETLIRLSKQHCPQAHIEMITNGDLLTSEKLSGLFKAGLTLLCISMYDGPHQVEYFNDLKKTAGLQDDQIVLRRRWLSPQEHFGITLSNRAGTVQMEDIGIKALKNPMKRACYYPFYQTLVDYDGSVLLCTHDWGRHLVAGNVNKRSILEIWNS
ncbi:MAG: radical SAM protein, partial [Candidatus Omnitrophica bacterium]|nr:radical SAM protein [Candidatus Omnitrophota bacterium]